MKQRIVVVIRAGALVEAYADPDIELILVDFDEQRHGASVEIVPDSVARCQRCGSKLDRIPKMAALGFETHGPFRAFLQQHKTCAGKHEDGKK